MHISFCNILHVFYLNILHVSQAVFEKMKPSVYQYFNIIRSFYYYSFSDIKSVNVYAFKKEWMKIYENYWNDAVY